MTWERPVESQPPRYQEQNFHGWWETELPDGNIGARWLNNSRGVNPTGRAAKRVSFRDARMQAMSWKLCQHPARRKQSPTAPSEEGSGPEGCAWEPCPVP